MFHNVYISKVALPINAVALFVCLLHWPSVSDASELAPMAMEKCKENACIIIKSDRSLTSEASTLVDVLRVRLANHNLTIKLGSDDELSAPPKRATKNHSQKQWLWVIHIRRISSEIMLVAIDNLAAVSEDDIVREIRRDQNVQSTAWTMALIIEEVVTPYLEDNTQSPAVGAGLAIIEPKVVGGIKKILPHAKEIYPQVNSIRIGVTGFWIHPVENMIIGPQIALEGLFSSKIVASFDVAWVAWSDFSMGEITGSMALIPIDVLIGYTPWRGRILDLTLATGFSVGFSIYKTSNHLTRRTDMLFEPMALGLFRIALKIHDPWRIYISSCAAIPLMRDRLENAGVTVYYQYWILPKFDIGILLGF